MNGEKKRKKWEFFQDEWWEVFHDEWNNMHPCFLCCERVDVYCVAELFEFLNK